RRSATKPASAWSSLSFSTTSSRKHSTATTAPAKPSNPISSSSSTKPPTRRSPNSRNGHRPSPAPASSWSPSGNPKLSSTRPTTNKPTPSSPTIEPNSSTPAVSATCRRCSTSATSSATNTSAATSTTAAAGWRSQTTDRQAEHPQPRSHSCLPACFAAPKSATSSLSTATSHQPGSAAKPNEHSGFESDSANEQCVSYPATKRSTSTRAKRQRP